MEENSDNRLLMSDSLRGMVPALEEEQIVKIHDSFLVVALSGNFESQHFYISGLCVGMSIESLDDVKFDIRLELDKAYDTLKRYLRSQITCDRLFITRGDDVTELAYDYVVKNVRLTDFDREEKMCTLGVDLIKK